MKRIILLIILASAYLYSYDFKLTQKDVKKIENSYNKDHVINRLAEYEKLKEKVQDFELIRKLSHVNTYINRILPKHDIKAGKAMDYWATPKEFLIEGHGDCEDYAIAKYFTLIELGIPKEKLYLNVVKVKGQKDKHMVLLYAEDKKSSPLVMDNLSFRVIPFTKRPDLTPEFAFSEIDAYILTREKFTQKVKINWGKNNKWEDLLNRVYKLKE